MVEHYKYLSIGSTQYERGDQQLFLLKATTPKPSDTLTLSDVVSGKCSQYRTKACFGPAMLEGLDQFDQVVSGWFDEVEKASQQAAAGLAELALQYIVDQSHGTWDFVTGWEVGFTTAPNIWRPAKLLSRQMIDMGGLEPYQKGDRSGHGLGAEQGTARFSAAAQQPLGTAIFLSNSAKHNGDQYAWKIGTGD